MQVIETLDALDAKLQECQAALQISDDALRQVFSTFQFDISRQGPADPFSESYLGWQMGLYEFIAGRSYSVRNEESVFDVNAARLRPFPYTSGAAVAGKHLSAIAFLLMGIDLKPGARILDVGPGWGNTTMALAQLGFQVTALDIEPRFCALIEARAKNLELDVEVINDDFLWVERSGRQFDAIVFFECFHHCADHMRLLRALPQALAPGGHVYFGAEPIFSDFSLPWGIRTDGESLWAIRQNGWLELGFRESYFREALRRAGLKGSVRRSKDVPWITVWDAVVGQFEPIILDVADHRLQTIAGQRIQGQIRLTGREGYGLYGPYLPLPAGRYRALLRFSATPRLGGRHVSRLLRRQARGCWPRRISIWPP
ncbi:class I SAM-dependent methyltransferase [Roseomonas gilardii subsp. gilardii]|uniref:class I SAM-dependent methyltransferase n=1 Tax=Roseomonas gilardii TaxID=257708 RepID=UPI001FFAFACA|nr:class I SAM-dependent methyltransferase [Roseomonas gilardii]UPG72881.1 class I SAM-dependent methyltransferase [Roseomonas gilardii subsp. gilardii]